MAYIDWYFNIETRITTKDGIFTVQLPDGHTEDFFQTLVGFESKRRGDRTYVLSKIEEGYYLRDHKHKVNYFYNNQGYLTVIEDRNEIKPSLLMKTMFCGKYHWQVDRNYSLPTIMDL